MYSYGPLHMAEQRQGDQLAPTYSSSVRIQGVALRTCLKHLACLATLKSCDTTKQFVDDYTLYIYMVKS